MARSAGRPHESLELKPIQAIADELGISRIRVQQLLHTALSWMARDKYDAEGNELKTSQLDHFYTLVRSTQLAKAQRLAQEQAAAADFHPVLQCTSIECNPSAWCL